MVSMSGRTTGNCLNGFDDEDEFEPPELGQIDE